MQRNKLLRRTPLKRKTRLRQRRPTPRRSGRVRDVPHMLEVKALGCLMRDVPDHRCDGPAQFDHFGPHGMGQKTSDRKGAPFCPDVHRQRQEAAGMFKGVGKYAMRMIMTTAIAETQARVARRG